MYNITVSGFGLTKTYREVECEFHEEFYVRSIDMFLDTLKEIGKYPEGLSHMEILVQLNCIHTYKSSFNLISSDCLSQNHGG